MIIMSHAVEKINVTMKVLQLSRVFQIVLRGGSNQKFYWLGFFYWVVGTWEVILSIQTFFKAKNNFM